MAGERRPPGPRPRSRPVPARLPTTRTRTRTGSRTRVRGRRRPVLRLPLAPATRRLHVVLVVAAMALSLCAGRLLQLQGFDSSNYPADALLRTLPLLPARGEITDRNGLMLASTQPAVAVTADPTLLTGRVPEVAEIVSRHLNMPTAELRPLLTKPDTHFVYLKKQVPALTYSALAAELSSAKIYGVFREADPVRTYPGRAVGSSVVGFVGADGKGQGGLELKYNTDLAGVEGEQTFESAPNGSRIPLGDSSLKPATNGMNYQLTLDSEVQWAAERRLAAAVKQTGADSAFAIVMDVKTGHLLALANAPGFDPNALKESDKDHRGNRAVSEPYEPGSVQKVLTAAALIDSGTADPETRVVVPPKVRTDSGPIGDAFSHDTIRLNLRGIIALSSNIGTVLLARQMDTGVLRDYLMSFGLGARTGIEVPGESRGIVPGADMPDYQRDRVAFGQSISVTGVQQVAAVAGIINGGVYHPPTLVKGATDAEGRSVPVEHQPPRRVVSTATSAQVRDLMGAVIDSENGQRKLKLDGYTSGGKTGTAQRAVDGGYSGYVTSFIGFAPLDDPRIITYVVVTNPRRGDTGTATAVPTYQDLMTFVLPRYSVLPDARPHDPRPTEWE